MKAADLPTLEGSGRILGERYQMRELLGRGGMGEVWRAFGLKLRVDVALKSIRAERAESERAQELLRQQEAREMASQFLSGLEVTHQAGLVHRDFKPENR